MNNRTAKSGQKNNSVLSMVRSLNRQVKRARRYLTSAQVKFESVTDSLRRKVGKIQRGLSENTITTGDRFSDFCIRTHGLSGTADMAWTLRELDKNIAQRKGQLVFIVQRKGEIAGIDSGPELRAGVKIWWRTKAQSFLGILSTDASSLDLMKDSFSLPIAGGVWLQEDVPSALPIKLSPRALTSDITTNISGTSRALEIIVGNEEVMQYVRRSMPGFESNLLKLAKSLCAS